MTLETFDGILRRHPLAIVDNLYATAAGTLHTDYNQLGTGIYGVLHQLLDHGVRTHHHLAGRDLVSHIFRQSVYYRRHDTNYFVRPITNISTTGDLNITQPKKTSKRSAIKARIRNGDDPLFFFLSLPYSLLRRLSLIWAPGTYGFCSSFSGLSLFSRSSFSGSQ